MQTATITSKGQLTVPKEIRDILKLQSGDKVRFIVNNDGEIYLLPVVSIKKLKGIFPKPSEPVTVEEMNSTISRRRSKA